MKRFRMRIVSTVLVVAMLITLLPAGMVEGSGIAPEKNTPLMKGEVVRGVVDEWGDFNTQIDGYNTGEGNALGTVKHPFIVLEIVPSMEYAEFGYLIDGCEPVNINAIIEDATDGNEGSKANAMNMIETLSSLKTAEFGENLIPLQTYSFSDEGESIASIHSDGKVYGYFLRVEDGDGDWQLVPNESTDGEDEEETEDRLTDEEDEDEEEIEDELTDEEDEEETEDGLTDEEDEEETEDELTDEEDEEEIEDEPMYEEGIEGNLTNKVDEPNIEDESIEEREASNIGAKAVTQPADKAYATAKVGRFVLTANSGDITLNNDGDTDENDVNNGGTADPDVAADGGSQSAGGSDTPEIEIEENTLAADTHAESITYQFDKKEQDGENGDWDWVWHSYPEAVIDEIKEKSGNLDNDFQDPNHVKLDRSLEDYEKGDIIESWRTIDGAGLFALNDAEATYENNDLFLKSLLGNEYDTKGAGYSIVVKTVTPGELKADKNDNWINNANLICISSAKHTKGTGNNGHDDKELAEICKEYGWLNYDEDGKRKSSNAYVESSKYGDSNDLDWKTVIDLYDKVTAESDYAALIMDENIFYKPGVSLFPEQTQYNNDVAVFDWNLEPRGKYSSDKKTIGCSNNVYKLGLMLMAMDAPLFKKLYLEKDDEGKNLNGDQVIIENGSYTKRKESLNGDGTNENGTDSYSGVSSIRAIAAYAAAADVDDAINKVSDALTKLDDLITEFRKTSPSSVEPEALDSACTDAVNAIELAIAAITAAGGDASRLEEVGSNITAAQTKFNEAKGNETKSGRIAAIAEMAAALAKAMSVTAEAFADIGEFDCAKKAAQAAKNAASVAEDAAGLGDATSETKDVANGATSTAGKAEEYVEKSEEAARDPDPEPPTADDSAEHWSVETFLLMPPYVAEGFKLDEYWSSYDMWKNYHSTNDFSKFDYWINDHVFTCPGDKGILASYVTASITNGNGNNNKDTDWFSDFFAYCDKYGSKYNYPNTGESVFSSPYPAGAVNYILRGIMGVDWPSAEDQPTPLPSAINVLDLEPSVKVGSDGKPIGFMKKSFVQMLLGGFNGAIEINPQTFAEFNGKFEDLASEYDMIYLGRDVPTNTYIYTGGDDHAYPISLRRKLDLGTFYEAGHPIIVEGLYPEDQEVVTEEKKVNDSISNFLNGKSLALPEYENKKVLCKSNNNNGNKVYLVDTVRDVVSKINKDLVFTATSVSTEAEREENDVASVEVSMKFDLKFYNTVNKSIYYDMYIDRDGDLRFDESENVVKNVEIPVSDKEASIGTRAFLLDRSSFVHWKIVVHDSYSQHVETGFSPVQIGEKIHVLQIAENKTDTTVLDSAQEYFNAQELQDSPYEIICEENDKMDLNGFEGILDDAKFSYNDGIASGLEDLKVDFLSEYDMIIVDLSNTTGTTFNAKKTAAFLQYWADLGSSIIYLNDLAPGADNKIREDPPSNLTSTNISRLNEGLSYPFDVDPTGGLLSVQSTKAQGSLVTLAEQMTVWYCLAVDDKFAWNDAMNSYYIYSNKNVFYSGIQRGAGETELKLFINMMIAAYSASDEGLSIKIDDDFDVIPHLNHTYEIKGVMRNYDPKVDENSLDGDEEDLLTQSDEAEEDGEDGESAEYYYEPGSIVVGKDRMYDICFKLTGTPWLAKPYSEEYKLQCRILYYNKASGGWKEAASTDGFEVYVEGTETKYWPVNGGSENDFGLDMGTTYILKYPKEYMGSGSEDAKPKVRFEFTDSKRKYKELSTVFNMTELPLFMLD